MKDPTYAELLDSYTDAGVPLGVAVQKATDAWHELLADRERHWRELHPELEAPED